MLTTQAAVRRAFWDGMEAMGAPVSRRKITDYAGAGVPDNGTGQNGDFCFRSDGTVAGDTVIYHKEGGSWVACTTT